jgi:hypothetical protein
VIATACGAVGLVLALLPTIAGLKAGGWKASALVHMGEQEPIAGLARASDPDFRFVHPESHYDGVYFYAMAVDPLATEEAHELIDNAPARYGHPGLGWLAALLTLGSDGLVPIVLLWICVVSAAVAPAAGSALAVALGGSPWWGLAVALNPGTIYSVSVLTSEPTGVALLLLTLYLWVTGKEVAGAACLVALCLMKDPFILAAGGLLVWEAFRWLTNRREGVIRRSLLILPSIIVFGLWYLYVNRQFGVFPFEAGEGLLGFPFSGWWTTIEAAGASSLNTFLESQIGAASGPLLMVFGAGLLITAIVAVRMRSAIDPVFLLLMLLTACVGPLGLFYAKDLIRTLAFPLALAPFVWLGAVRSHARI